MIYLFLSILISSGIFIIFKLFDVYKINILQAIVTNYLVAFVMGVISSPVSFSFQEISHKPWLISAIVLGVIFISVFNVMALTAQKNGLSVASVSGKMSVIIPILFGVVVYQESLSWIKIIGIILAFIAVYLTAVKDTEHKKSNASILLPVLLFLGSGVIDTFLKFVETTYLKNGELPLFLAMIFICAFTLGILLFIYQKIKNNFTLKVKNIVAGIVLGIPNYYSMAFLLKALQTKGLESSTIFTVNNVSIVLLTTFLGLLFFKEKMITKNWIGIGVAIISIILTTIAV